jgi:hypothetical protein
MGGFCVATSVAAPRYGGYFLLAATDFLTVPQSGLPHLEQKLQA